jgi:exonuclease SbcD
MTVVAVPWVPERLAISYEALFGKADESRVDEEYAESMERALRFYGAGFVKDEINVLLGHMWVNKAVVMKGGGERPLQTDMIMGIKGGNLPKSANYIALGHVHKPQAVPDSPVAGASFFSGSLVQLDFGEAGQEKSVRVVEIASARTPADCKEVPITGGRGLRDVRATLDSLPDRVAECGDDYLRVFVTADGIVPALYEQVRDVLPNALDVQLVRTDVPPATTAPPHTGLEPRALVEMYYKQWKAVDEAPKPLLDLFTKLHEEAMDATA